jgi:biopolymer transport protein ExbD
MAKIKSSKKASSVDMTAMCDVAFLLLTFFILTATAKVPEALPVDTPAATNESKLPERDLATLTIGGKGKVFLGFSDRPTRRRTLELMSQKYAVPFSPEELDKFELMDTFGVPMQGMSSLIKMKSADRNLAGVQTGIPKDSLDNQLKEWIYNARIATKEISEAAGLKGVDLKIAIKGDAKEQYPAVQKVMDILQDQQINNFNLVTSLRGKDF